MFDARKNWNDWAAVWWKNYDDMLSRFHTIPACYGRTDRQTDGRTDGQTELLYQYRASAAVRSDISSVTSSTLNDNQSRNHHSTEQTLSAVMHD